MNRAEHAQCNLVCYGTGSLELVAHWVGTKSKFSCIELVLEMQSHISRYLLSSSRLLRCHNPLLPSLNSLSPPANFHPPLHWQGSRSVILLTKLKIVDNSENAKKVTRMDQPYCIKLPRNNRVAKFGDIIKIAHRGKVHNALLVSNRRPSKWLPRYDSNNIILLNEKFEPIGTRIFGPLPSAIRRKEGQYSKIIAIATKFI